MKRIDNNAAIKISNAPANLLRVVPPETKSQWQKIAIADLNMVRFIAYKDIVYCQSVSNYTNILTRQGKTVLCSKTLKEIESRLPCDLFIRIHASYLVNREDITALKRKDNWELEINHELWLPVSRQKKEILQRVLVF